jgi:hypothetical protein
MEAEHRAINRSTSLSGNRSSSAGDMRQQAHDSKAFTRDAPVDTTADSGGLAANQAKACGPFILLLD